MDRVRISVDALEHLVGGLGTALLALAALMWVVAVALSCVVGVGVLLVPSAVRVVRAVGGRDPGGGAGCARRRVAADRAVAA